MIDDVDAMDATSPQARLAVIANRAAAQMGDENFPVALRVLPSRYRDRLTRFYDYARFVDDIGDTAAGDRLELLDLVAADVRSLFATGTATLPVVAGLRTLRTDCHAPAEPFLDLIEANRMDQRVSRYTDFDDLLGYCALSAAPVGRVVLYAFASATPSAIARSDQVCAALQVLEHCQDVGEDARAGRIYLPADDLATAGVCDADLAGSITSPGLRAVVGQQVRRSRQLLTEAGPLVGQLRGWARVAVAGFAGGGRATADALERAGWGVLEGPVKPTKPGTAGHAVRLLIGRP